MPYLYIMCRFKGVRRVRNVNVQSCGRLSANVICEFVSRFNTNPLTLGQLDPKLADKLPTRTSENGNDICQPKPLLPKYTSNAFGSGMRIFVWQAGGEKDWDIQRVLYRCCDVWCSVRTNKLHSVQIELFMWIRCVSSMLLH